MDASETNSKRAPSPGDRFGSAVLQELDSAKSWSTINREATSKPSTDAAVGESLCILPGSAAKRAREFAFGLTLYSVVAWVIDYPLYAAVVWLLGAYLGGLVMMAICLPIDLLALKAYDWSKRDWLAVEFCKERARSYKTNGSVGKFLQLVRKCPLWMRVLLLSARFDPFLVTIMTRKGAYRSDGMTREDYGVFLGSFLSGHLWWTASIWASLEGVRWLSGGI